MVPIEINQLQKPNGKKGTNPRPLASGSCLLATCSARMQRPTTNQPDPFIMSVFTVAETIYCSNRRNHVYVYLPDGGGHLLAIGGFSPWGIYTQIRIAREPRPGWRQKKHRNADRTWRPHPLMPKIHVHTRTPLYITIYGEQLITGWPSQR